MTYTPKKEQTETLEQAIERMFAYIQQKLDLINSNQTHVNKRYFIDELRCEINGIKGLLKFMPEYRTSYEKLNRYTKIVFQKYYE